MLGIQLERNQEISLSRQIYKSVRDGISEGRLPPGQVIPSTREMARQLAVSRNTVCEAYEMLAAEGYIETHQGAPTRVAPGLELGQKELLLQPEPQDNLRTEIRVDFRTGRPDLSRFPQQTWLNLVHRQAAEMPIEQWGYSGPAGLPELREEIAAWLFRSKGMTINPQDVFITAGATQALHLLAELLPIREQGIIVEDPCHMGMLRVLQRKKAKIIPIPADAQGMQTQLLNNQRCTSYVTPSHQYPLGGILPAPRRAELIRFARNNDQYIIEDDYDSEFRYQGPPVAPLYSLDPQRVIYVGTFSKTMFPALRIGYVVLPASLQLRWCDLRTHADVQNPPFEQAALAEYLRTRRLDRHVQEMRRLYGRRRKILLDTLHKVFGNTWCPWGDAAGLHLAVQFPGRSFDADFSIRARSKGMMISSVENHSIIPGFHMDKLLLGYGHLEDKEIIDGVWLLGDFIKLYAGK